MVDGTFWVVVGDDLYFWVVVGGGGCFWDSGGWW